MSNAFEQYADEAGYRALPRHVQKQAQGPSELDRKMDEKQRLSRAYKAARRADIKAVLQREPRLTRFRKYLKSVGPDDADELLDAIRTSWLPASPVDVRIYALRLVDARAQRIKLVAGDPYWFDDPLPPELGGPAAPSVYRAAAAILYPRGRG